MLWMASSGTRLGDWNVEHRTVMPTIVRFEGLLEPGRTARELSSIRQSTDEDDRIYEVSMQWIIAFKATECNPRRRDRV